MKINYEAFILEYFFTAHITILLKTNENVSTNKLITFTYRIHSVWLNV